MGQNIEVKNVQRTEYLDKNGLDMLWAKIKENAHNQVEVERNRAVAKENSITNSLNEFVRKTSDDDQTINSDLMIIGGIGIAAENIENTEGVSLTPTRVEFSHANNRSSIQLLGIDVDGQNGSAIEIKTNCENPYIILSDGTNDNHDNGQTLSITNKGITCNNHTQNDGYFFAANGEIKDIYNTLDINIHRNFIEGIDTSISNEGLSVFRNTADGTNGIKITDSGILVNSTLTENSSPNKVFATDGSIADLTQYAKKNEITAGGNVKDIVISGESIVENNVASIDFSTKHKVGVVQVGDGLNVNPFGIISVDTTALTALQKKVTANTAAISGKQDAGNYIPFEKRGLNDDRCYIIAPSYYIECRTNKFDNGKYNYSHISSQEISLHNAGGSSTTIDMEGININEGGNASNEHNLQLSPSSISSRSNSSSHSLQFRLSSNGLELEGGRGDEVLTSNGSTIDITQYAKKSDIPEVDTSDFISKTATDDQSIKSELDLYNKLYLHDSNDLIMAILTNEKLEIRNPRDVSSGTNLTGQSLSIKENRKVITVTSTGISSSDNNANHVYTTDGGIATLPTVPTKVSQLQNDSEFIIKSVYDEKIAALEARIAALEANHAETA